MRVNEDTIAALIECVAAAKATDATPSWAPLRHKPEVLGCGSALWIGEAIRMGLRFELVMPASIPIDRPLYGLTANLFAGVNGTVLHLCRIEFDPAGDPHLHRNKHRNSGAPREVSGPHYHPFKENLSLGIEALGSLHDLPIAFPLEPKSATFHEALDTVRAHFGIPGLWLEEPPCSTRIV